MKHRVRIAIILLLAAMLACSTSDPLMRQDYSGTKIVSIRVVPPSGTGSFILEVTYQAYLELNGITRPGEIYCNYVAPDTATMLVGKFRGYAPEYDKWVTQTQTLPFSVAQADGVVQPGTYLAGCSAYDASSQSYDSPVTTTFTVVTEGTPTASSAPNPVPTTTPSTPTSALTWGRIAYDKASDQQTPHLSQSGLLPSEFHKWCNPSITIDANGAISGTCSSSQNPADLGLWGNWMTDDGESIEGKITGTLVPGGSFTFREELTERYENPEYPTIWWYTKTVVIEGTGTFVSTTQARGTATYSAECIGSDENSNFCGEGYTLSAHDSFTGTINWEFNGASQ